MIHVCHIISGDQWAGAEVMLLHLLKNLKNYDNLNISTILFNEGRLAKSIRSLDIPVEVVDETKHNIIKFVKETRKILIRNHPDIIHSHRYKENIVAFLSSRYNKNIRLVSTQHGMPEYSTGGANNKYTILQKINFYLLSKSFARLVVVSNDIRHKIIKIFGFSDNNIIVIRNGIELPKEIPPKKEKDIFIIGSMGRMFPVKDYPLMVEVAREVKKETGKIRFELAGDGPDMEKVSNLVERFGLENVFILKGYVEDITEYYRNIDLYINTSVHEGIPMTVLEAMSYGIPVIAPEIGGIKEIIKNGSEGFLVNGRDPKKYAKECIQLLNDKLLWRKMGDTARDTVKREFTNERMAKEYQQMYSDVAYVH